MQYFKAVRYDGRRVAMEIEYDRGLLPVIKQPQFRGYYLPPRRVWCIEASVAGPLMAAVCIKIAQRRRGRRYSDTPRDLAARLRQAFDNPTPDCVAPYLNFRIFPLHEPGAWMVAHYWDPWLNAALAPFVRSQLGFGVFRVEAASAQQMAMAAWQGAGVRPRDVYVHPERVDEKAAIALIEDGENGLDVGRLVRADDGLPIAASLRRRAERKEAVTVSQQRLAIEEVDEDRLEDCARKGDLKPFQVEGVRHLVSRRTALLADDMGLGKTRQGGAAILYHDGPALVTCPASLQENWRRELSNLGVREVGVFESGRGPDKNAPHVLIAHYDQLPAVVEWGKTQGFAPRCWVADESQLLKNPDTRRVASIARLVDGIPYRYLMSGTPVLNREEELHTQLRLAGHPLGQLGMGQFRDSFAGAESLRARLAAAIGDWMLRRIKTDVLEGFPGRRQKWVNGPLPESARAEYEEQLASARGRNPLAKLTALRRSVEQIAAREDLHRFVVGWVTGPRRPHVVFANFRETLKWYAEHLARRGIEAAIIDGDTPMAARQEAVDRLQGGELPVLLATTGVAGTGWTMTASRSLSLLSPVWTGALRDQIEARIWRLPQTEPVTCRHYVYDETVAAWIHEVVEAKNAVSESCLTPENRLRWWLGPESRPPDPAEIERFVAERIAVTA